MEVDSFSSATKLGANAASGIAAGLNELIPVAQNPLFMLLIVSV